MTQSGKNNEMSTSVTCRPPQDPLKVLHIQVEYTVIKNSPCTVFVLEWNTDITSYLPDDQICCNLCLRVLWVCH
jgi:hypothetical protein